ncbi:MAG: response regulator [Oscillospiraceae bacterium]
MYKAVVIDDEAVIREGMCNLVPWGKYDCTVVGTADDGVEGGKLIREKNPDIIIVDICMPNQDGLSMLCDLKDVLPTKEITIMTGFGELDYARQAIKIGVTRYLMKPSQIDEIEEALYCMVENLNVRTGKTHNKIENHLVNAVLQYIEAHYNEKITLIEIAELNFVSVWHLSKLINKYCEKTFKELLNETRMRYARKFLQETNFRVYEVSEMVGVSDITYFSKIFKKYSNGVSPNEYRNTN